MKNIWITKRKERMNDPQTAINLMAENQKALSSINNSEDFAPLVQKIYDRWVGFNMVSVQPMLGPCDLIKRLKYKFANGDVNLVIEEDPIISKTHKLRTKIDLDLEETAKSIREEITREIATDLTNNAGTVSTFNRNANDSRKEQYEALYIKIMEISSVIHRKTLRGNANWLYMNEKTAGPLIASTSGGFGSTLSKGIYYRGTLNCAWRLIIDTEYPDNQILMGYKGDSNMDAGYFYCPYLLTHTSGIFSEEICTLPGYLNRRGKKLSKEGSKYYAKLTIT